MSNNLLKKKKKIDMLSGSLWTGLPMFALPIAATGILQQLFNASDIAVVGNFSGDARTVAVAAVGATAPVISLILNFFIGLTLGTNVVIANAIGRKDHECARNAAQTSIIISLLIGVVVAVIGELIAAPFLEFLDVPADVLPYAVKYLRIYFGGVPLILLYNFESAIFRSMGDTKTPLIILAVSGVLNVLLNLFFVIVIHMTVDGVALATVISNSLSAIVLFIVLVKKETIVQITLKKIKIDRRTLAMILKIGMPSGLQNSVFAVANVIIQSAINTLGSVVMAASSAAMSIENICYFVLSSFSQACTTFVGQNYGAGQINRCKKVLGLCVLEDAVCSGTGILIMVFAGRFLLSIFNNDPEVVEIGYQRLIIILVAYIFSMLYENFSGYLRGFGVSLTPAIITMVAVCGIRMFWIKVIFVQSRTLNTIMTAYPVSLAITAIAMFIAILVIRPARKAMEKQKKTDNTPVEVEKATER